MAPAAAGAAHCVRDAWRLIVAPIQVLQGVHGETYRNSPDSHERIGRGPGRWMVGRRDRWIDHDQRQQRNHNVQRKAEARVCDGVMGAFVLPLVHAGARHLGYILARPWRDLGAFSPQRIFTDATCSGTAVVTQNLFTYATANVAPCVDEDAAPMTKISFSCRADAKEVSAKWCAIPTPSRAPAHRPSRVAHVPVAARLASASRSCVPPE